MTKNSSSTPHKDSLLLNTPCNANSSQGRQAGPDASYRVHELSIPPSRATPPIPHYAEKNESGNFSIRHWPSEQRPRERLIREGPAALSDAELLAIFLRTGLPGESAVAMAQRLLGHFGTLSDLLNASLQQFDHVTGIGPAKYAQLQAILEMSRRTLAESLRKTSVLNCYSAVRDFVRLTYGQLDKEHFAVLFLNVRCELIASQTLAIGTLSEAAVYPREVVRAALKYNAASVILTHNHPSGHCKPSQSDDEITQNIQYALALLDINVLDHLIVTANECFSYATSGRLPLAEPA